MTDGHNVFWLNMQRNPLIQNSSVLRGADMWVLLTIMIFIVDRLLLEYSAVNHTWFGIIKVQLYFYLLFYFLSL